MLGIFALCFVEMIALHHQESIVLLLCLDHGIDSFPTLFEIPQRGPQFQDFLDCPMYLLRKLFVFDLSAFGWRLFSLALALLVEVKLTMMYRYLFFIPKLVFEVFFGLHDHIFLLFVDSSYQQDGFRLFGSLALLTWFGLQSSSVMVLWLFVLVFPHVCEKVVKTFLRVFSLEVRVVIADI